MTDVRDRAFEDEILAAIRAPLVRAISDVDARVSARASRNRLVAAACAGVLIAGGAVAVWRAGSGGGPRPEVQVAPARACAGTALELTGSGLITNGSTSAVRLDLRNRSSEQCAVPYPTLATVLTQKHERVTVAGVDPTTALGPTLLPGATTRLLLETPNRCAPDGTAPAAGFSGLVVTVGDWPFAAPDVDLTLCKRGFAAVRFETPPPGRTDRADPVDPKAVIVGPDSRVVHLRHVPTHVGTGIGNGVTASSDGRLVAYEFGSPIVHEVAFVDTKTCATHGCAEDVIGRGHSPVLGPNGTLAYIALDDIPLGPDDIAMWKRPGAITVRDLNGMSTVWAHGTGFQTVAWAGNALLVLHDVPDAQTEGFEELFLYRGPNDRIALPGSLIAISPDGTRLLLGGGTDQMLQLYDVPNARVVSSISIADYEHAIASPRDLEGVDLSRHPGYEESLDWPVSCCANFDGASLWQGDTVLFPMTVRSTRQPARYLGGTAIFRKPAPTLVRIVGDRILPPRTLNVLGVMDDYDAGAWLPGSTTEFALARNDLTPPRDVRCTIEGDDARCVDDPSAATVFRRPTVMPDTAVG